jgi:hypothetical protein
MTKRHILVITQYFWPESFRINNVVHGLRDLGNVVPVNTEKAQPIPVPASFPGRGVFGRAKTGTESR